MTHLQRQLAEIYEKSGYSEAKIFWQNNQKNFSNLSPKEFSDLKSLMKRICQIEKDSKTAEIISYEEKGKNAQNKRIVEYLLRFEKYYHEGSTISPDAATEEELYSLIFNTGDTDDLYRLGEDYYGYKSYEKAFECFHKCAMKGNRLAQFRIGEMYMQGRGVGKKRDEAMKWYRASNDSSSLSVMKIPSGIAAVGECAFEECRELVKLIVPESVGRIEKDAFKGCRNLRDVEVANENISIIAGAFDDCENLSEESKKKLRDLPFVLIKGDGNIKDFVICKYQVTQDIYEKVMGENPSHFKGPKLPVENVSCYDAIYFCNLLSKMEGLEPVYRVNYKIDVKQWEYTRHKGESIKGRIERNVEANGYRLPTEAEWEYAARGGKNYRYSGSDNLDEVGWYDRNSYRNTHTVGQKKANDYGLYDMSGNVSEWCWNFDSSVVLRGGSCYNHESYCVVSYPVDCRSLYCSLDYGFRLVRSCSN